MKPIALLLTLALASCAPYARVTEVSPKRPGITKGAIASDLDLAGYVHTASLASDRLRTHPDDVSTRAEYNYAVSRICGLLRSQQITPGSKPVRAGRYTLSWAAPRQAEWDPRLYELIPVDQLRISGLYVKDRAVKPGLGAPVVAKRVANQLHEYAPTPHFYFSATVVARFQGSHCVLSMENPLEQEDVSLGDRTYPLSADLTAPLAMMLVEMNPKELELPRLLHPAQYADTTRIARLEPFDPNKTVVLMVHGLMDSPATWFPMINHLRMNEDIRKHYQFWFFSYPSGYPYPYSAALLRNELDAVEKHYRLRTKIVLIGHSMGGCISRLLITDANRQIWDTMFEVPPSKMDIPPAHKHILTESTIFDHRPEIGRVIFISAPHRGSNLASAWLGRIGSSLVKAPSDLLKLGNEGARYTRHPKGELHLKRIPDSVDTLAPNNEFVLALGKIPVQRVPHHSIVGDRGRGDSPRSSDGVVPYWSSHMRDAESEKVVPSHHSAHQHPDAISEVHRILTLHSQRSQ